MPKSNYLENKLVKHIFTGVPYTAPTTIYAALIKNTTVNDTIFVSGAYTYTEPSSSAGYSRQSVAWAISPAGYDDGYVSNTGSGGVNGASILFGPSTIGNAWGTIYGLALFDSGTYGSGECLYWIALGSGAITPAETTAVIIPVNKLIIGED
jgi:hypothetical protein